MYLNFTNNVKEQSLREIISIIKIYLNSTASFHFLFPSFTDQVPKIYDLTTKDESVFIYINNQNLKAVKKWEVRGKMWKSTLNSYLGLI